MMRKTKFGKLHLLVCLLLSLCLMFALVACGDDIESSTPKGKITLAPTTMTVDVGKDAMIQATLTDIAGDDIAWVSSDPAVATVKVTNAAATTKVATVTGVAAGTATITATAGGKSATCVVTVKSVGDDDGGDDDGKDKDKTSTIANGEEHDAYIADKKWIEWHDQGWNNAVVEVTNAKLNTETGAVTLTYSVTSGAEANGEAMQLFWHDPSLTVGAAYMLNIKINASVAGTITINGTLVELESGDNNIELPFAQIEEGVDWAGKSMGATVRIQFGVKDVGAIAAGTFVLSDMEISTLQQTTLQTPSFTIGEDNVINITDANTDGVGRYALGLFKDGATDPFATIYIDQTGDTIDTSRVENGTYDAKLMAKAVDVRYVDSDWSEVVELTVENEGGVKYDLNTDVGAGQEANTPGTWCAWADQNWCGSTVTVSSAKYDNGTITVVFTSTGTCDFGLQVKYFNPNYVADTVYTFDIEASVAMTVQVGSTNNETVNLEADKKVKLTGHANASFYVHVNIANNLGGTLTISNVVWAAPVVKEALAAPTALAIDGNTFTVTPADGTEDEIEKYEIGFFRDGKLEKNFMITDGTTGTFDVATLYEAEYSVKVRAIAKEDAEHKDSEWYVSEETVTGSVGLEYIEVEWATVADSIYGEVHENGPDYIYHHLFLNDAVEKAYDFDSYDVEVTLDGEQGEVVATNSLSDADITAHTYHLHIRVKGNKYQTTVLTVSFKKDGDVVAIVTYTRNGDREVVLDSISESISLGETTTINVTSINGSTDLDGKVISWTIVDTEGEGVATIPEDSTGASVVVTAVAAGKATLTCTVGEGEGAFSKTCAITVVDGEVVIVAQDVTNKLILDSKFATNGMQVRIELQDPAFAELVQQIDPAQTDAAITIDGETATFEMPRKEWQTTGVYNLYIQVLVGDGWTHDYVFRFSLKNAKGVEVAYATYTEAAPKILNLDNATLTLALKAGETVTGTVTATKNDKVEGDIVWTIDNPEIATIAVSDDKLSVTVTAVAKGTATVTATVDGLTKTCAVNVLEEGEEVPIITITDFEKFSGPYGDNRFYQFRFNATDANAGKYADIKSNFHHTNVDGTQTDHIEFFEGGGVDCYIVVVHFATEPVSGTAYKIDLCDESGNILATFTWTA